MAKSILGTSEALFRENSRYFKDSYEALEILMRLQGLASSCFCKYFCVEKEQFFYLIIG